MTNRLRIKSFPQWLQGVLLILLFLVVFVLVTLLVFINSRAEDNFVSYSDNNRNVFDLSIPSSINFCGEDIPKNDFRLKSILEKEFKKKPIL